MSPAEPSGYRVPPTWTPGPVPPPIVSTGTPDGSASGCAATATVSLALAAGAAPAARPRRPDSHAESLIVLRPETSAPNDGRALPEPLYRRWRAS
jgi:hypothetical protein